MTPSPGSGSSGDFGDAERKRIDRAEHGGAPHPISHRLVRVDSFCVTATAASNDCEPVLYASLVWKS